MGDPAILIEFFEKGIPLHNFLGLKVRKWGSGWCQLVIPYRWELVGDPSRPALHGGVAATLADAAGGFTVFTQLDANQVTSTVDIRVDYLRPGRTDIDLQCDAQLIRIGNRVAVADMVVHHGDPEEPVAKARGVYNVRNNESDSQD